MEIYSEKEKENIGHNVAEILCLRKVGHKNTRRYRTTWGDKTAIGIFEVIRNMGYDINQGIYKI